MVAAFVRNGSAVAGLALVALVHAAALVGPALCPVVPLAIVWRPLAPPGEAAAAVPLGSDFQGCDVLAGILHGGRAILAVGASAAAGFHGGLVDGACMRIAEFFQVLPSLLFAMAFVSLFGPGPVTVAVAIGVASWPPVARLARAEVMRIKALDHVRASRAIGASNWRLLGRAIRRNRKPPPCRCRVDPCRVGLCRDGAVCGGLRTCRKQPVV